jgi:hypothetical protein
LAKSNGVIQSLVTEFAGCCGMVSSVDGSQVNVSVVWPGIEETPVCHVNQMLAQVALAQPVDPEGIRVDEILLSFGYITPPVTLGTPEEQAAMAQALSAVVVRSITRLSMTKHAFLTVLDVLNGIATQIENAEGGSR